jgi:DNA-binding NarL/FixJ family response regulator
MLVEASEALRIGLSMIFSLDRSLEIVAEADSAQHVLQLVAEHAPDVVVLDVDMQDGDDTVAQLAQAHPNVRIVVLTIRPSHVDHQRLIKLGAFACIEKRASPQDLLNAVQAASTLVHAS